MATQITSTSKAGTVLDVFGGFQISTQSSFGSGAVSQQTLEGIAGGKLNAPSTPTDANFNFLDKLAKSGLSNINATQGSSISQTWSLAAGQSLYWTVTGQNKDYYNDFAWASVKYVGNSSSPYSVPSYFESETFDAVAVKIDKDFDWATQEVVSFTAPVSGNFTFAFGVVDAFDTAVQSTITVSNATTTKPFGVDNALDLYSLKFVPGLTGSSSPSFGSGGISSGLNFSDIKTTVSGQTLSYITGNTGSYNSNGAYYKSTNTVINKGGISFDSSGITISTANANAKDYEIEEFLGLSSGTLDKVALQQNNTWGSSTSAFYSNATSGAAYKQLVEVSGVGAKVSFDYFWDGGDYLPYNDFAAVTIGGKVVKNESQTSTTLFTSTGQVIGSANGYSGSNLGSDNKALVSVAGAGNYNDVQGKFEYSVKANDKLFTIGGKQYVELGIFATDVNDEVVDSKIVINNIGSNASPNVASNFASVKPAFVGQIVNEKEIKQQAIVDTLSKVTADNTGKSSAANQQLLQNSLLGFDASLIAGSSNSIFTGSGTSSTSFSSALSNFDFSALLSILQGGSLGGDFKIDANINFNATISSAALGVSASAGGSVSFNALASATSGGSFTSSSLSTEQWSKVDYGSSSVETKKTMDWSKVVVDGISNETLSQTDYVQAIANGASTTSYSSIDWKTVNSAEFSSTTYNQLDWNQVKFGDLTTESKKTLDWSKVKVGSGSNAVTTDKLSTTDLLQVTLAGGSSTLNYNSTDWSKIEAKEFSQETYSELDWSKVNLNGMTSESKKSLDWNKVSIGDISSEQKKSVDWSKIDINGVSSEKLSTTDKLQISINGNTEESYKTTDWTKVQWGEFSDETYAATNWSLVKLGDVTTEEKNSLNWQKVKLSDVSKETKSTMNWKNVDVAGISSNTTTSTTDSFQVLAANGQLLEESYATTDWSKIIIGEFSSETYAATDWSLVNLEGLSIESKKEKKWSLVDDGVFINETASTTDKTQWLFANGDSTTLSKKTKWNKLQIGEFSQETYSNIDWSQVNMGAFQKTDTSTVDWEYVQFGEFTSKQNKQTNWSLVQFGDFSDENYAEINWGEVNMKGAKSINYSTLDWSKVQFNEFTAQTYKKTNWNQVQFGGLSDTQYSEINWGLVKTKGMSSETVSNINWSLVDFGDYTTKSYKQQDWSKVAIGDLTTEQLSTIDWNQKKIWKGGFAITQEQYSQMDWNQVIQANNFSSTAAKSVNWSQVSAGQVNEASMAKLESFGLKGKAAQGIASLKAQAFIAPQSNEVSFLGLTTTSSAPVASATDSGSDSIALALGASLVNDKQLQLV